MKFYCGNCGCTFFDEDEIEFYCFETKEFLCEKCAEKYLNEEWKDLTIEDKQEYVSDYLDDEIGMQVNENMTNKKLDEIFYSLDIMEKVELLGVSITDDWDEIAEVICELQEEADEEAKNRAFDAYYEGYKLGF